MVEAVASGVSQLQGCIFVGHTNTDTDRSALSFLSCLLLLLH